MHIKKEFATLAQALNNGRPHGDVGYKMAVHDIDVNDIGTGGFNGPHLLVQPGKIGGEDRGRNQDGLHSTPSRTGVCRHIFGFYLTMASTDKGGRRLVGDLHADGESDLPVDIVHREFQVQGG